MAAPPYTFQGRTSVGTIERGEFATTDLPAWVEARFDEGWTELEVLWHPTGTVDDSILCGSIHHRPLTIHPKTRRARSWVADDHLGWRHHGDED